MIGDTRALLQRRTCTGRALAVLLGRWTWAALVRRPVLSVFSAVYRYVQTAGDGPFTLWPSAAAELVRAMALAPLLVAELSRPTFGRAVAVDASDTGMGVTACDAQDLTISLLPRRPSADMQTDEKAGVSIGELHWSTIVARRWAYKGEHINALELRAADTALRWTLSSPFSSQATIIVLTDSAVAAGALQKGRSSSPSVLLRLRRIAALLLASGAVLDVRFIRSEYNPADGPSRR